MKHKYPKLWQRLLAGLLTLTLVLSGELFSDGYTERANASELTADAVISLSYVDQVTISTPDSVVCLNGTADTVYQVPIRIQTGCTLILDQIQNEQDITITADADVTIRVNGANKLRNIIWDGGAAHTLTITGDVLSSQLTAGRIACASETAGATAVNLNLSHCQINCDAVGCGSNGRDASYYGGSATMANATPGTHASPHITVQSAVLNVAGSMACGGNGTSSTGTWAANASDGGCAGEVLIDNSTVTIGGSLSVGGKGGDGELGSMYYSRTAGTTQSSAPVTIQNHSIVSVAGNVATQQSLPQISQDGKQNGLNGVTVTVCDSELTAKDIASGGAGHLQVFYSVYAGSGASYNIYGTAGGRGGTIIAKNSVIRCERAVCGADAGEYRVYEVSMYGTFSGDYESKKHPLDGNGGCIRSEHTKWVITGSAGAKGSRWNAYANPSVYSDQLFDGGSVSGTVYGNVITTDATALLDGTFAAAEEVRNFDEQSCAACVLHTADAMADQSVLIDTQAIHTDTALDASGSLHTYLSIGDHQVKLTGSRVYSGLIRVRRSAALNDFYLTGYGELSLTDDDAYIHADSYTHRGEDHDYSGSYTVSGSGGTHSITVDSGTHTLIFGKTDMDTLEITGTADVTVRLEDVVTIKKLIVSETASLTVIGTTAGADGTLTETSDPERLAELFHTETIGQGGTVRDADGNRMFPLTVIFDHPAAGTLTFTRVTDTGSAAVRCLAVTADTTELSCLLSEGYHDLTLCPAGCSSLSLGGRICLTSASTLHTDDLTLYGTVSETPVTLTDTSVICGTEAVETDGTVCLIGSDAATPPEVYVERKDAELLLKDFPKNATIRLPEDFTGTIRDADTNAALTVVTVHTEFPEQELTFTVGTDSFTAKTNANGDFTILLGAADQEQPIRFEINGETYYPDKKELFPSGGTNGHLTEIGLSTTPPDADENEDENGNETTDGNETEAGENTSDGQTEDAKNEGAADQTQNGDTAGTSSGDNSGAGGSASEGSSSGGGYGSGSGASSSGGYSSGSYGGISGSTAGQSSGSSGSSDSDSASDATVSGSATINGIPHTVTSSALTRWKPVLALTTPAGIRLLKLSQTSKKVVSTKQKLQLSIKRNAGVTYYYRLMPDSSLHTADTENALKKTKWKRLTSDTLTIQPKAKEFQAGYIMLKAVKDGSTVKRKTTGFVIDCTKPVVSGVKNMRIYRGKRTIRVTDNCDSLQIRLNKKTVKSAFTVKKRGVYRLTAKDAAGNKKTVIFAVW